MLGFKETMQNMEFLKIENPGFSMETSSLGTDPTFLKVLDFQGIYNLYWNNPVDW